jgi:hypothetical protein
MLTKTHLLQTLKSLPEQFSMDDLLDKIMLIEKIEIGLDQSRSGQTLTTEEAKEKLNTWLK